MAMEGTSYSPKLHLKEDVPRLKSLTCVASSWKQKVCVNTYTCNKTFLPFILNIWQGYSFYSTRDQNMTNNSFYCWMPHKKKTFSRAVLKIAFFHRYLLFRVGSKAEEYTQMWPLSDKKAGAAWGGLSRSKLQLIPCHLAWTDRPTENKYFEVMKYAIFMTGDFDMIISRIKCNADKDSVR